MHRVALLLCLATAPLARADGLIPPEEWRQMAQGRTLTYEIEGMFFANEHYDAAGDGVMLQLNDGRCLSGRWFYREGAYCFAWDENRPSCFVHRRRKDRIEIVPVLDGEPNGAIQLMTGISDKPLVCGGLLF